MGEIDDLKSRANKMIKTGSEYYKKFMHENLGKNQDLELEKAFTNYIEHLDEALIGLKCDFDEESIRQIYEDCNEFINNLWSMKNTVIVRFRRDPDNPTHFIESAKLNCVSVTPTPISKDYMFEIVEDLI